MGPYGGSPEATGVVCVLSACTWRAFLVQQAFPQCSGPLRPHTATCSLVHCVVRWLVRSPTVGVVARWRAEQSDGPTEEQKLAFPSPSAQVRGCFVVSRSRSRPSHRRTALPATPQLSDYAPTTGLRNARKSRRPQKPTDDVVAEQEEHATYMQTACVPGTRPRAAAWPCPCARDRTVIYCSASNIREMTRAVSRTCHPP